MKNNIVPLFQRTKWKRFLLMLFLLFTITVLHLTSTVKGSYGESTPDDPYRGPFEYVKGELIVTFNEHVSQQAIDAVNEALGGKEITSFKEFGISHIQLPEGSNVNDFARVYEKNPNVKYAEPNFIYYEDYIPTDTDFLSLWALHNTGQTGGTSDADIDAVEAWDTFNGDPSPNPKIVVGVVDSGIEYTHEDLADNMWINPGEIAGNNTDDDNNGYIDDIHGINTTDDGRGEGNPMEDANDIQGGHGTAVAGVIGAVEGNGVGIVGVNFNVELMALKFIRRGEGQLATALECLNYVIDMKKNHNVNIRVLNNSWGGGPYSQALSDAIDELKANDILFIGGAGNLSRDTDVSAYYPASFPNDNVISVAGTDFNDSMVSYSSFGASTVDVFAPTENIRTTMLNNSYTSAGGVSMSVAYTTGLASLLFGYYPSATYADVRDIIFSTVDRPVTIPSGKTITGGRINANNALNPDYPGSLPPVVTKIVPVFGSIGATVTINGSHFGVTEGSVTFNGIPTAISTWSDTEITCTVPDGAATGKIEVTTNSSVSNPTNPIFTVSCMDSRGAMPTAVYRPAVAVHNGKIYAIGGFTLTLLSTGQVVNEDADFVQIYDTLTDTFSTTTDANGNDVGKPTSASNACAATIDGKIYVAGGYVPTTPPTRLDVLEVYDIASNTWDTTKAPLPKGLSGASAVALNGMLYVMGGASTGVSGDFVDEKELYRYDPVVDTWTQLSPMSTNRTFFGAAVINGKIYVCGGHGDAGFLNSTEVYDPSTDTWTPLAPMNFARYDFGCVAISGKLVAFGGNDSVESPPFFDSVEIYDPETDQWSIHDCPLSIARQGVRGAVVDNNVYALCGMNGPQSLYNVIDVLQFDSIEDIIPDQFLFIDQTDVSLSTLIISNAITVTGINTAAAISIAGNNGEYSVNGGAYVTTAGTVNEGDTVTVRQTSSANFSTTTDTTLTIGGVSDTFSVTTLAADPTPTAPSNLVTTALNDKQIDLNWTDNSSNETGFRIERSLDQSNWTEIATTGTDVNNYTDSGLSASTTYYFQVRAYNDAGNSVYSNIASATTNASPPSTVEYYATSETAVSGQISGVYTDTWEDDDFPQVITEIESGGKPSNRYSYLEHTWHFTISAGFSVTFYANVYKSNSSEDNFIFQYSTDGQNFINIAEVNSTDINNVEVWQLPTTLSGEVSIRVIDSDRNQGNNNLDSISIDQMFIQVESDTQGIDLSATGYKVKGVQYADLTWSGANSAQVEIYRDGALIDTVDNTGAYTDNIGSKGGGAYTYQICESGGGSCSNTVEIVF
ncbi:MAG: S8 family serine peptidase [Candidatus Kuenenia sp.]|nr:S8 family serine peptidase [Candidatus Kuenenia hertensis]